MKRDITILGAGESGTAAALLAQWLGYAVFVSDKNALKPEFRSALEQAGVSREEGQHSMETLLTAQEIIKSPGIPEKAEVMQAIRTKGIPVIDEIEFAWRHMPKDATVVAITGSNGKTTTTGLIHQLLVSAGFPAALGGNIGYGFARLVLQDLQQPVPGRIYVVEVSSFQLENIDRFHPKVAVLLNITPDHLDRYDYKLENYARAKFQIIKNQGAGDSFIYNAADPVIEKYKENYAFPAEHNIGIRQINYENGVLKLKEGYQFDLTRTKIRGPHNHFNAVCAIHAALTLGADPEKIQEGLNVFNPPAHRLEVIDVVQGVTYINDSKATNVDAVFYALQAMEQPVVWIVGGQDKGNDYTPLMALVREKVKAIVCMGLDNKPILEAFQALNKKIVETKSAREAVQTASKLAVSGDTVLLSPACASFDIFRNYEDRGEQFRQAVQELERTQLKIPG